MSSLHDQLLLEVLHHLSLVLAVMTLVLNVEDVLPANLGTASEGRKTLFIRTKLTFIHVSTFTLNILLRMEPGLDQFH